MKQLFLFILVANAVNANGQGFSGVQAFRSDIVLNPISYTGGKASIGKMVFDSANNKYILGGFDGVMDVDPGPNVHNLTSVGAGNMFLLKEDAAGNFVWVKHFAKLSPAGPYGIGGSAIDLDASGNIYIAGTVSDSVDIDPGPGVYRFSTDGARVAFILKLDASGNFVWAKKHEADSITNSSFINGMKIVGGAIYAAAGFIGTVDLDPGPAVFNVTGLGSRDMALVRMDTAGNFIWGKTIGGSGIEYLNSLATDSAANLYITGGFQGTVDFDPGAAVHAMTATPHNPNTNFPTDIFIARYDAAGNYAWAHRFGNQYDDRGNAITLDRFGNVLVTGYVTDFVDFDPGPGVYNVGTFASKNMFTLKLDNNGNFVWVKNNVGGGFIATDDTGNVFIAGSFNSSVSKLNSAGNTIWSGYFGPSSTSSGIWSNPAWIGLDNHDTIYVAGAFAGGGHDFDPCEGVYYDSGLPYSQSTGYILKLNQVACPVSTTGIEHASLQTALSVYPNPSPGIVTFSSNFAIHRIKVTDLAGKVVYMAEPNKDREVVGLGGTTAGVYFYEVDGGAGKHRGKLVIH